VRRTLVLLPLFFLALPIAVRADAPPVPSLRGVDHAKPQAYLALDPAWGDPKALASISSQLRRETPEETLGSIGRWMNRNLRLDEKAAYSWRTTDQIRKDGTYGGCADHAILFGLLARAAGIPTVWVKTMDIDWILDFRAGRPEAERYRGHVFLEVHIRGKWALLDASQALLYADYDAAATVLPGSRLAYDKGGDPYALVLSCRWEEWKAQTDAFFRGLDLATVPWSRPKDLLAPWSVFVAGDAPRYEWAVATAKALGFRPRVSFNTEFERHLAAARGSILVVTVTDGRPVLPEDACEALLPEGYRAFLAEADPKRQWMDRRHADGTRVVLVRSQARTDMERALAEALR
jgi:transglutaminase-like putative cysteine protease